METIAQLLWILGSLIVLTLGTLHLVFTLFTEKLHPRSEALINEMKEISPRLTKDTTMWKTWIGFNCSHSTGAMFFGLINLYFGLLRFEFLMSDLFLILIDMVMAIGYCIIGLKYWFKIPNGGMLVATAFYILALCLITAY